MGELLFHKKNRRNGVIIRFSLSSKDCFAITFFKASGADSAVFCGLKIATNFSSNCPDPCIRHCFNLGKFARYLVTIFAIKLFLAKWNTTILRHFENTVNRRLALLASLLCNSYQCLPSGCHFGISSSRRNPSPFSRRPVQRL